MFHCLDVWQLLINAGTTSVTFLIHNSRHRYAAATQAKLDELILAVDDVWAQFIGIEHETNREIEKISP